jgi:hypothetical protein
VNLSAGLNRICVVRNFSEFYEPYPKTRAVNDGHYLVSAAASGDEKTVVDILDSGIDPNCRGEQVCGPILISHFECGSDVSNICEFFISERDGAHDCC